MTWSEANARCAALADKATLVSIRSTAENDYVFQLLWYNTTDINDAWIGGKNAGGTFRLVNVQIQGFPICRGPALV